MDDGNTEWHVEILDLNSSRIQCPTALKGWMGMKFMHIMLQHRRLWLNGMLLVSALLGCFSLFFENKPRQDVSVTALPYSSISSITQRGVTYSIDYEENSLVAHQSRTAKVLWYAILGKGFWGVPVVTATAVYVNLDNGGIAALDIRDGSVLWRTSVQHGSTSAVLAGGENRVYVRVVEARSRLGTVEVLKAGTGSLVWRVHAFTFSRLIVSRGMVFLANGKRLHLLDPRTRAPASWPPRRPHAPAWTRSRVASLGKIRASKNISVHFRPASTWERCINVHGSVVENRVPLSNALHFGDTAIVRRYVTSDIVIRVRATRS